MNKRTKNKLKHRNIDISKHKPKMIIVRTNTHLDSFTKSDLEDDGSYEIEVEEGSYEDFSYARLYHLVERPETQEELANRICTSYDQAKSQQEFAEKRKQQLIEDAKKLGMEFKK